MRRKLLVLLLFASTVVRAEDAGTLALLILEKSIDTARITAALQDGNPLTRATAARLANAREIRAVVPLLRDLLGKETNADVAREQLRALVMLGEDDDVAFAVEAAQRFPGTADAVAGAIARIGGNRALDLHLKHRAALGNPTPSVALMFWGRPQLATAAASRLLGAGDAEGWRALLVAAGDAGVEIDPNILTVALRSERQELRAPALSHVARRYGAAAQIPAAFLSAIDEAKPAEMKTEEAFPRELIRRMRGGQPVERPEWTEWIRRGMGANSPLLPSDGRIALLTKNERAEAPLKDAPTPGFTGEWRPEPAVPFQLPGVLPPGLGEAVIAATRCRDLWLGLGAAAVDRQGRVIDVKLQAVKTSPACRRAIETLFRLSLANPAAIDSPTVSNQLLLARAARQPVCLDEAPTGSASARASADGDVQPPKVLKRVDPDFPEKARQAMSTTSRDALIVVESVISRQGCVRSIRILQQTPYPDINGAAVLALSQWRFKPGTLDGQPVDVIFNLTVNFKLQ
jgi:TonB family protein